MAYLKTIYIFSISLSSEECQEIKSWKTKLCSLLHNIYAGESFVHVTFTPHSSSGQVLSD